MRDLTRTCDEFKAQEHKARQQLNANVLHYAHAWPANNDQVICQMVADSENDRIRHQGRAILVALSGPYHNERAKIAFTSFWDIPTGMV